MTPALGEQTRASYESLAGWVVQRHREGLRVLGVCGAQGSGKSTLAAFLAVELAATHGLHALPLPLDDFYLGRSSRSQLAERIHPLLATRGVPGTHDVARGTECLRLLKSRQPCPLPQFSKAHDDTLADRALDVAPDLVIFEGWCVGVPPQAEDALAVPVNALEREEDPDGRWRRHVNAQLAGPYAQWFGLLDAVVFLQVPGWDSVRRWRAQQEKETAAANAGVSALQDDDSLQRFLQHYQRLTLHALEVLPPRADIVLSLDAAHEVKR